MSAAALRDHYRAQFATHGDAALATQMSREGQHFRFGKLLEIGDLTDRSVLDVGSGLGDLYPFLREAYPAARYEGVDVVPEMVASRSGTVCGQATDAVRAMRKAARRDGIGGTVLILLLPDCK